MSTQMDREAAREAEVFGEGERLVLRPGMGVARVTTKARRKDPSEKISKADAAQAKKEETRKKLLEAARSAFVELGFHATKPQDISKRAKMGHGTFYLHFEDKLDCFLTFASEAADELEHHIAIHTATALSPEPMLRQTLEAIFAYSDANPGVMRAVLTDVSFMLPSEVQHRLPIQRWADTWARIVDFWKARGEVPECLDSRLLASVILGGIRQAGWNVDRSREDRDQVLESLTRIFMGALTAPQLNG